MTVRNVCFTINNPTGDDVAWCDHVDCGYIVYGRETGAEGTRHLQGYVEFKASKRFTTLKAECPRGHFERRMGSAKQAADYCKKEQQFTERGTMSKQGKRSDLEDVSQEVLAGVPMAEIAQAHPSTYIRYSRGIERLQWRVMPDRTEPPRVVWLWGKAGTGKTRLATQLVVVPGHNNTYYIKDNSKWWDGYEGQHRIIIDDFDKSSWDFRDLLRLLDRYPYQGQTKGGYVKINSPEIYITCEFAPRELWSAGNELDQLLRRVAEVAEVGGNTRHPLL